MSLPPQTTALPKTVFEAEVGRRVRRARASAPLKVQRGDTLTRILARLGAQTWQVRADAWRRHAVGFRPRATCSRATRFAASVLPLPARPIGELVRFSVLDETGAHKVTVTRNGTGEYVAERDARRGSLTHVALPDNDRPRTTASTPASTHLAAKHGMPTI